MSNIDPTDSNPADIVAAVWASVVRTAVPVIVAAVVTFLTSIGFPQPNTLSDALSTVTGALFAVLYYLLNRLYEAKTGKASRLLGARHLPVGYRR